MLAGLSHARGAKVAIIDGDLQHPPSLLAQMVPLLDEGVPPGGGPPHPRRRPGPPHVPVPGLLPADQPADRRRAAGRGRRLPGPRPPRRCARCSPWGRPTGSPRGSSPGSASRPPSSTTRTSRASRVPPSGGCATSSTTASTVSSRSTTARCGCRSGSGIVVTVVAVGYAAWVLWRRAPRQQRARLRHHDLRRHRLRGRPADPPRGHRGVPRPHLRRDQAPPALPAPGEQRGAAPYPDHQPCWAATTMPSTTEGLMTTTETEPGDRARPQPHATVDGASRAGGSGRWLVVLVTAVYACIPYLVHPLLLPARRHRRAVRPDVVQPRRDGPLGPVAAVARPRRVGRRQLRRRGALRHLQPAQHPGLAVDVGGVRPDVRDVRRQAGRAGRRWRWAPTCSPGSTARPSGRLPSSRPPCRSAASRSTGTPGRGRPA